MGMNAVKSLLRLLVTAMLFAAPGITTIALGQAPEGLPKPPEGKVTVKFWAIATQGWKDVIAEFSKAYPNIDIKWTKYSTDELKQALRVASASGKMPDMWFNWGGTLAAPYIDGGHALEITPEIAAKYGLDKNISPVALDLAKRNGKLYGVPIWVKPMTIFYKKSLFDKYGIPEPKTFADLEKAMETLKSKGVTPIAVGGKFSWMTMRTTDFLIEHFAGPEMHDKLFALEASYNSPEVVEAFAKLKDWVVKGYFNDGFISLDPNQALPLLYQNKAGMIFQGPWIEEENIVKSKLDPKDFVPIIAPADQTPVRISGFQEQLHISSKSPPDVQNAALLFAAYISQPEVAKTAASKALGTPRAVLGVSPGEDRPIGTQMAKWVQGDAQLYLPTDQALPQELVNAFFQAQDSVVLGTITPEAAAEQMQKAVDDYKAANKQ
jgi:raffinose/stachyose/melibiose transport system substrate-binding protein